MNIQMITKMLIDAGIEPNEAKKEIKMLLEHFCHYTELDRCKGVELSEKQLESLKEKAEKRANTAILQANSEKEKTEKRFFEKFLESPGFLKKN